MHKPNIRSLLFPILLICFSCQGFAVTANPDPEQAAAAAAGTKSEAQAADKPVLSAKDIKHFIDTLPALSKELEAYGAGFNMRKHQSAAKALAANQQVRAIFDKYGWNAEGFYTKMATITAGFAIAEMQKQLADLPPDQRAMVESAMKGQMPEFSLHPKDLALIKTKMQDLRKLFESME